MPIWFKGADRHGVFMSSGRHMVTLREPHRSVEYSRPYQPGDPTNFIDWRLFARTDQLQIRQKSQRTSHRIAIHLDRSETMRWPDEGPQKADIAASIAMHIAAVHLKLGDHVRIYVYSRRQGADVCDRIELKSLHQVIMTLEDLRQDRFQPSDFGREQRRNAHFGYWIGDFLTIDNFESRTRLCRNLLVLHLLHSREASADWLTDSHCYRSVPGAAATPSAVIEYIGRNLTSNNFYERRLAEWYAERERTAQERGAVYRRITDQTQLGAYLNYLSSFLHSPGNKLRKVVG